MTLIELMVVVAILGVLTVVTLPLLSNSSDSRKSREAARALVSYVSRAQNRGLGRVEWGGFWLVPVNGSNYALDLFSADVPAIFQGDNLPTTVTGSASISGTTPVFVITSPGGIATSGSIGGATVSGTTGDLVRFNGLGPWYGLVTSTMLTLRGTNPLAVENANQTTLNTPWPASGVPLTYELLRQPIRSGSPFTFSDGRCVDVGQSGYGGRTNYTMFGNSPGPIAVLFDGNGRLRQVVINGGRVTPTDGVYLLVGRTDRAVASPLPRTASDDSTGYNWEYADSYWVGIDPHTGVVKVAECTPNAVSVVESQTYVRSELLATGR